MKKIVVLIPVVLIVAFVVSLSKRTTAGVQTGQRAKFESADDSVDGFHIETVSNMGIYFKAHMVLPDAKTKPIAVSGK